MEIMENHKSSINKEDYKYYETIAGTILLSFINNSLIKAEFIDKNLVNLEKKNFISSLQNSQEIQKSLLKNIYLSGTDFQIKVWEATIKIPSGETVTYQELAQIIGAPKSFRAVANALGQNKIAYFVPCHRIIRKNGDLGGYKWGIETKRALLEFEKTQVRKPN